MHTIRLRAANRPARLTATRPTLNAAGLLRASGTTTSSARGVVRLSLEYSRATDGQTVVIRRTARISGGRWQISSRLSPSQRLQIAGRCGSLDSTTQFTGYLPGRMRGEQRFLQVLPATYRPSAHEHHREQPRGPGGPRHRRVARDRRRDQP